MGFIHKLRRSKKGQQFVEMVIVLPVVLFCLAVVITAGQLVYGKIVSQMAAYEGARLAVVMDSPGAAKSSADARASELLENGIALTKNKTVFKYTGNSWTKGNFLTFEVHGNVRTLMPMIYKSDQGTYEIRRNTPVVGRIVMRIERS